ncbi:hypothetical protein JCM17823_06470 [Halorubrum gandharaense]
MSQTIRPRRIDLDSAFKLFGAVAIAIAAALTIGVLLLTDPFGELVTTAPLAMGTAGFGALLLLVTYTTHVLGDRRQT